MDPSLRWGDDQYWNATQTSPWLGGAKLDRNGPKPQASCTNSTPCPNAGHGLAGSMAGVSRQSGRRMVDTFPWRGAVDRFAPGRRASGPRWYHRRRYRPGADPQNQHVGQAALRQIQALAAQGGPV